MNDDIWSRHCIKCAERLSPSAFAPGAGVCKACRKKQRAVYRAANLDDIKDRELYYSRVRQAKKGGYAAPKLATRSLPDACECCGKAALPAVTPGDLRGLRKDHCHVTGDFRGWICDACNLGIGKLGDTLEGVLKAVRYLERAQHSD